MSQWKSIKCIINAFGDLVTGINKLLVSSKQKSGTLTAGQPYCSRECSGCWNVVEHKI